MSTADAAWHEGVSSRAATCLGADGALAAEVAGFAPRREQQRMAQAVERALADQTALVVEAGTGTGKTFAYLVPALLSGLRLVISTGTRHLQDQLFHRDLPAVRSALGIPLKAALLKGRSNYLCLHRLHLARAGGQGGGREGGGDGRQLAHQLEQVFDWAGRTASGDLAELSGIPEQAPVWPHVSSTADNCLGSECEYFGDCHVLKARREAQAADLVVINHHLLCADMVLREEGFGELLPGADAFIIDEAHQLPDTAARFFGQALSSRQLLELAQDASREAVAATASPEGVPDQARRLETACREFRLLMGEGEQRAAWNRLAGHPRLEPARQGLHQALDALVQALEPLSGHSRGLDNCYQRGLRLKKLLALCTGASPEGYVHWYEAWRRSFRIHLTPLDVADNFGQARERLSPSWIFTSATLSVDGDFGHFARRMGLEDVAALCLESPFDYSNNALFYIPENMPNPAEERYTGRVLDEALAVIRAARGRSFVLFTSYRALGIARRRLREVCPYPLLVQGDAPRSELLERFRELGNAVLLGTSSFWEGVDVRGEALSCVIIDKLPFASPGDPVWQARIEAVRARGGNPFMDEQLPHAVILLKQGVGRLIRDVDDRGVLVICDPRLLGKPYGRVFLHSLPAMRRTRAREDVEAFFQAGDVLDCMREARD